MVEFKRSQVSLFLMAALQFAGAIEQRSHHIYTSRFNSLKCEVTDRDKVQLFSFITGPSSEKPDLWWLFIIVALVLVVLLIIVVKVVRRQRTKGKKTQMNDNIADPEDDVSYASISYTNKSRSKGQVLGKDEDDDEAATYTTVKASSSSAGASNDLSGLYASIIKPKT